MTKIFEISRRDGNRNPLDDHDIYTVRFKDPSLRIEKSVCYYYGEIYQRAALYYVRVAFGEFAPGQLTRNNTAYLHYAFAVGPPRAFTIGREVGETTRVPINQTPGQMNAIRLRYGMRRFSENDSFHDPYQWQLTDQHGKTYVIEFVPLEGGNRIGIVERDSLTRPLDKPTPINSFPTR
ncbi:hypothetical protein [Pseudomonas sp. p21]|uniref:hypothetical protein n=1 Tax=Pseudomonas sp. p21 TaxID=1825979 RepID=UPI000A804BDA|nr:hypothetical protein [Pseudomonas sp. p21]